MKKWEIPFIEELSVQETAYDPDGGCQVDGCYTSRDGKYELPTYGPSSGNTGIPGVEVI